MRNVIILGASGNIARRVIDALSAKKDVSSTLFLRHKARLGNKDVSKYRIIEGDIPGYLKLTAAIKCIMYVNLTGDLGAIAKYIIRAMQENNVKRSIVVSSIGIYATPLPPMLKPYRQLADVIEFSGLAYTILRPTCLAMWKK